eukprot:210924-Pyramimonas_sp.AAC.1
MQLVTKQTMCVLSLATSGPVQKNSGHVRGLGRDFLGPAAAQMHGVVGDRSHRPVRLWRLNVV